MPNYNKVLLMGNLTRDVEIRHLPNGQAVGNFGMAMNRKFKTADGELREETTFVDCEVWGKVAEKFTRFFSKGKPVFIEGRLKLDTWQDKTDGSNRSKLKVTVDTFEFVESRGGGDAPAKASAASKPRPDLNDEDIPF